MGKSKQPTATAFTRSQESWAEFVLSKIKSNIEEREDWLREKGWNEDDFNQDDQLLDLYDEELFFERYAKEMVAQREFLRKKYFGE